MLKSRGELDLHCNGIARRITIGWAHSRFLVVVLLLIGSVTGCTSLTFPESEAPRAPMIIHAPGIGGPSPMDRAWLEALRDGGLDADMEMFDWTGKNPGIDALQALERNQGKAQELADRLTQLARNEPEHPIILSSNSGGVGVAIWALEKLPADVNVQTLILTAPAISPDYDLTRALRHVRSKCLAFTSMGDALICGFGTSVFGTIDRVNTDSAGRVGFRQPVTADRYQYAKLEIYSYQPEWARWGDFGGHAGSMVPPFAKNYIAPLLMADVGQPATVR